MTERKKDFLLVLWVTAWVDDAVHVKVEVVKLDVIWIRFCGVHGDLYAIHTLGLHTREERCV